MKLPKTLYVAIRNPGSEEAWMEPGHSVEQVIEDDGPTTIGVYRLEKKIIARKDVVTSVVPKKLLRQELPPRK